MALYSAAKSPESVKSPAGKGIAANLTGWVAGEERSSAVVIDTFLSFGLHMSNVPYQPRSRHLCGKYTGVMQRRSGES